MEGKKINEIEKRIYVDIYGKPGEAFFCIERNPRRNNPNREMLEKYLNADSTDSIWSEANITQLTDALHNEIFRLIRYVQAFNDVDFTNQNGESNNAIKLANEIEKELQEAVFDLNDNLGKYSPQSVGTALMERRKPDI